MPCTSGVNGPTSGLQENAKSPAEFDITPYVRRGLNLLACQVHKYVYGHTWKIRTCGVGRHQPERLPLQYRSNPYPRLFCPTPAWMRLLSMDSCVLV